MHAKPLLLISFSALALAAVRPAHAGDDAEEARCELCDPAVLVGQARDAMEQTLLWRVSHGDPARPAALPMLQRAWEDRGMGDTQRALPFARQAAARCFLGAEAACADALILLADSELIAGGGERGTEERALALYSLVPWENLPARRCAEGMVLRYRLSERLSPRRADPRWADRCGPLGEGGELGYRSAKAALLRGDLEDAERRLWALRRAGTGHVVRSTYLLAVIRVAEGRSARAARLFGEMMTMPIEPERAVPEDAARTLAALQLARLAREAGELELAQELYSAVPPYAAGREDALLEGAVVAGNRGDLGAAQLYLDALESYRPQEGRQLALFRLRANLAVIDGEEEVARATFAELTRIGREVRARWLGDTEAAISARLVEDPSLGGLLDADQTAEVVRLEQELGRARVTLDEGRDRAAALRTLLGAGDFAPDLDAVLEELRGADALLRRAEQLVGQGPRVPVRIAGPASAALAAAREAAEVRRELDAQVARIEWAKERRKERIEQRLGEVDAELKVYDSALAALELGAAAEIAGLKRSLIARAREVADDLEMSEEVGELEMAWRRKLKATKEVARARNEYDDERASLAADVDEGWQRVTE
jgi:hypothetical protein